MRGREREREETETEREGGEGEEDRSENLLVMKGVNLLYIAEQHQTFLAKFRWYLVDEIDVIYLFDIAIDDRPQLCHVQSFCIYQFLHHTSENTAIQVISDDNYISIYISEITKMKINNYLVI